MSGSRGWGHRSRRVPAVRTALAAVAAAVLTSVGITVGAAPAAAHDQLLSVEPEPGEIDALPEAVTMTYSNDVAEQYVEAALVAPDGDIVRLAPEGLSADGPALVVDLADAPAQAAGTWQLVVRIVSADGHPVESTVDYAVAAATAPDPSPAPAGDGSAARGGFDTGVDTGADTEADTEQGGEVGTAADGDVDAVTAVPSAAGQQALAAAQDPDRSTLTAWWPLVAAAVALVAVGVVIRWVARRR